MIRPTLLHCLILSTLLILCGSCSPSRDVVGKGWIQKRKYTKGYHVNLRHKRTTPCATVAHRNKRPQEAAMDSLPINTPKTPPVLPAETRASEIPMILREPPNRHQPNPDARGIAVPAMLRGENAEPTKQAQPLRSEPKPSVHPWANRSLLFGILALLVLFIAITISLNFSNKEPVLTAEGFRALLALVVAIGILAIRDGAAAIGKIRQHPERWKGKGTAGCGLAIGTVLLMFLLVFGAYMLID